MAHDWILDVLTDLREFAGKNGLAVTEQQIDRTLAAVTAELASMQGMPQGTARVGHVGCFPRPAAGGRNS